MLVAGAAALLVGLSDALINRFNPGAYTDLIQSDPIRVIQAIIAGISFLGAGTIFRHPKKQHVEGLTTAASLLFSGAIGICVALRQFVLAVAVTLLTLIVLRGVEFIERRINKSTDEG
jgi:putative Mg2+ transporter-C (MgtC) family protein